jgi:hypothetical protein
MRRGGRDYWGHRGGEKYGGLWGHDGDADNQEAMNPENYAYRETMDNQQDLWEFDNEYHGRDSTTDEDNELE